MSLDTFRPIPYFVYTRLFYLYVALYGYLVKERLPSISFMISTGTFIKLLYVRFVNEDDHVKTARTFHRK